MSEVQSGLEGVVAFATEIAEPDKEGGALRYRGVDIEDLVGAGAVRAGLGPAGRRHVRARPAARRAAPAARSAPATRASTCSPRWRCSAPEWGFEPLIDISDEEARDQLARASVMALSLRRPVRARRRPAAGARSARSTRRRSIPERFLIRWRGEADPDHVKAIDAYWISAAEHGMNASTFTARVVASTGADVAAALSARGRRAVAARCTAARRRAC